MIATRRTHLVARLALAASLAAALVAGTTTPASAAAFGASNVVIYRVGTGSGSLGSPATAAFLDEYTPSGTLVQTIALPTTVSGANYRVVAKGDDKSEGALTRSGDTASLAFTGYDAALATTNLNGSTGTAVRRVVGLASCDGVLDTTTGLTDAQSKTEIRGAYSTDGDSLWVMGDNDSGGSAGIWYTTKGDSTSTNLIPAGEQVSHRFLSAFGGQLYETSSSSSINLAKVGSGLPTSLLSTPAFTSEGLSGSFYAYHLADLSPSAPGLDTLYIVEDGSSGGILKYSRVAGTWVASGKATVASSSGNIRGLTATVTGSTVKLFATTAQSNGALFTYTDATGYNTAIPAASAATLLTSAGTNKGFRGVALAPSCPPVEDPISPAASWFLATAVGGAILLVATTRSNRRQARVA